MRGVAPSTSLTLLRKVTSSAANVSTKAALMTFSRSDSLDIIALFEGQGSIWAAAYQPSLCRETGDVSLRTVTRVCAISARHWMAWQRDASDAGGRWDRGAQGSCFRSGECLSAWPIIHHRRAAPLSSGSWSKPALWRLRVLSLCFSDQLNRC